MANPSSYRARRRQQPESGVGFRWEGQELDRCGDHWGASVVLLERLAQPAVEEGGFVGHSVYSPGGGL